MSFDASLTTFRIRTARPEPWLDKRGRLGMTSKRMETKAESRREPRVECGLKILIWGIDATGTRFAQSALARNISAQGALVTGLDQHLRTGDLVGVQYGERRARFRVVWWRNSQSELRIQAAVQKMRGDECPWDRELDSRREKVGAPAAAVAEKAVVGHRSLRLPSGQAETVVG